MLARVVAVQCRANFISVTIPAILSSAVGDSEKALSDVFRLAKTCR
jgi:SpoVK/Ycf46/Vps4 family AAA+-type ATPase